MPLTSPHSLDKWPPLQAGSMQKQTPILDRLIDGLGLIAIAITIVVTPNLCEAPLRYENKRELVNHIFLRVHEPPRLSRYDEIIQRHAHENNVDWRLVASMIHAESSFRRHAISPQGAQGLMQIMPVVAEEQGVEAALHPEENIRAGVNHFSKTFHLLIGATFEDKLKLSLAAYNAGLGHVRDAQRLAIRKGLNPHRWKHVKRTLALLQKKKYYEESRFGYCKASETIEYVDRVLDQYQDYKHQFSETPVRPT